MGIFSGKRDSGAEDSVRVSEANRLSSRRFALQLCGLLGSVLVLHLLGRAGYYQGLYGFAVADTFTLCALLLLCGSATVTLHRTYSRKALTRVTVVGSFLIVLGQAINIIDGIPAFGGMQLPAVRSFVFLKEPVSVTGVVLFLTSLYWSVYEAYTARHQLQRERETLQERVDERTAEITRANQALQEEVAERKRAEQKLRESEEKYRTLIEDSIEGIGVWDSKGVVLANRALLKILGYDSLDEFNRTPLFDTIAPEWKRVVQERAARRESGQAFEPFVEFRIIRKDGEARDVAVQSSEITIGNKRFTQSTFRDITEWKWAEAERRHLEAQVQHAQKLESLGVLAGGIAHDFNNLLHLVLGNVQQIQNAIPDTSPARPFAVNIQKVVHRAAALTHQMLAYSGKGRFSLETLDLGETVSEIICLIQSSVSKKTSLQINQQDDLPPIKADATQIQQVTLNLILNASEALDEERGGQVTVSMKSLHCTREDLLNNRALENCPEGDYVCIEVSDTGRGMNEETLQRLFDPFFTTKFTGRGLGMSAVLGIVRGHKGAILVESTAGKGTTIRVLFPATAKPEKALHASAAEKFIAGPGHSGTILFVDDEPDMLELGIFTLKQMGYSVVTACDGIEAIEVFKKHTAEIDLVLLDLSMPRMDGRQTLLELRRIKPGVRVMVASGYAEHELEAQFAGSGVKAFIEKPYDINTLSAKLQQVLC